MASFSAFLAIPTWSYESLYSPVKYLFFWTLYLPSLSNIILPLSSRINASSTNFLPFSLNLSYLFNSALAFAISSFSFFLTSRYGAIPVPNPLNVDGFLYPPTSPAVKPFPAFLNLSFTSFPLKLVKPPIAPLANPVAEPIITLPPKALFWNFLKGFKVKSPFTSTFNNFFNISGNFLAKINIPIIINKFTIASLLVSWTLEIKNIEK